MKNLRGHTYGSIHPYRIAGIAKNGDTIWKCTCICRGEINVEERKLENGDVLHCNVCKGRKVDFATMKIMDE